MATNFRSVPCDQFIKKTQEDNNESFDESDNDVDVDDDVVDDVDDDVVVDDYDNSNALIKKSYNRNLQANISMDQIVSWKGFEENLRNIFIDMVGVFNSSPKPVDFIINLNLTSLPCGRINMDDSKEEVNKEPPILLEPPVVLRGVKCPVVVNKYENSSRYDWSERVFFPNGIRRPGLTYWEKDGKTTLLDPEYNGTPVNLYAKWVYFNFNEKGELENRLFLWVNQRDTRIIMWSNPYEQNPQPPPKLLLVTAPFQRRPSETEIELFEYNNTIFSLIQQKKLEEADENYKESIAIQESFLGQDNTLLKTIKGEGDHKPYSLSIPGSCPIKWPSYYVPKVKKDNFIADATRQIVNDIRSDIPITFELYSPNKEIKKLRDWILNSNAINSLSFPAILPKTEPYFSTIISGGGKTLRGKTKKLIKTRENKSKYTRRNNF